MNNLEWLYEHERDKLVKLITGEYDMCDICFYDPDFPDCGGDCERNVREWLMAEYVDDQPNPAQLLRDYDEFLSESCRQDAEQGERQESPDCESDSREKLEADARSLQTRIWKAGANSDGISLSHIIELLNRQASITSKEWCWTNDSLQEQVNMLTEQRDHYIELFHEQEHVVYELRRKLEIADRHEFESDQACDECKEHTDELLAKLIAERGEWKEKYESLLCAQESSRLHENDSREKLEADMRERLGELWADAWDAGNRDSMDDNFDLSVFIALLDHQAAITEREIEKKWSCFSDSADGHISKLQKQVDELTAERDYWKSEVEWCMQSAYPPSHSPERAYNPDVMAYPDRHGCTTPSTLVSAVIDGLRDEKAPEYMGLLDEIVKLKEERDGLQDLLRALERELKIARGDLNLTLNNWEQAKGKIRRQTEELAERKRKLDERDRQTIEEIRDDRADYWKSRAEKAEKEREQWRSKCGKLMGLANEMMSA